MHASDFEHESRYANKGDGKMLRKFNPPGVVSSDIYHHGVEVTSFQQMLFISGQVGVGRMEFQYRYSATNGIGDQ